MDGFRAVVEGNAYSMLLPGLKRHRILAGLTQQELAERAGIHRASIAALENTKHPARPRTLKKLADALGVRTQDLTEPGNTTHEM